MEIKGVSLDQFRDIVKTVSDREYDGNIVVQQDAHSVSDNVIRARLDVVSAKRHGARYSGNRMNRPRRVHAASWHAYRDVLTELFERFPNARVKSGRFFVVTYDGKESFERQFPETYYANVGSLAFPSFYGDLSI